MGRVRNNVEVAKRRCWTLFDGGARNSYIIREVAQELPLFELERPEPVALGGKTHQVRQECYLSCLVEGLPIQGVVGTVPSFGKVTPQADLPSA